MKFLEIIRKAFESRSHPGMDRSLTVWRMLRQGIPYYLDSNYSAYPPVSIYWNVNSICNLRCKMCDVGTSNEKTNFYKNLRIDRKLHEIKPEIFKRVVDEIKVYKPVIAINGTEPTMYKPLPEIIKYAKQAGLWTSVTTGAYLLADRAEELAEAGLDRINVSIDGPENIHNKIRGRNDVYQKALNGILIFKKFANKTGYNPEVSIDYTITNLNYGSLIDFYESISNYPIDRINFVNMNFITGIMAKKHNRIWGGKYKATENCISDEVRPDKVDVDVLVEQINQVKKIGKNKVHFLPDFNKNQLLVYYHKPEAFIGELPCFSTWVIAQVMADGEVIPYTRCYHIPLGNINNSKFMDIWNGEKAKLWRKDLKRNKRFPACTRCDLIH